MLVMLSNIIYQSNVAAPSFALDSEYFLPSKSFETSLPKSAVPFKDGVLILHFLILFSIWRCTATGV